MPKDQKLPIFHATKSLDVEYIFDDSEVEDAKVVVKGADIHARLYGGYEGMLSTREDLKYTKSIDNTNLATSSITLLHTDTSPEEGALGEEVSQTQCDLSVSYKDDRILSSINFYDEKNYKAEGVSRTKSARNEWFNSFLDDRVKSFSSIVTKYDIPRQTVTTPQELKTAINSEMFHEEFHHSEQAAMHYLSSMEGMKFIVDELVKSKAVYLYGIVLDIYTERMLCKNCNACLLGMQNSYQQGFLGDLSEYLEQSPIYPRVNGRLMLSTRASASKPPKRMNLDPLRLPDDPKVVHEYNPDKTNKVFQAENSALGTKKIIKDSSYSLKDYSGAFFLSSPFSKKKLEKAIQINLEKKSKKNN